MDLEPRSIETLQDRCEECGAKLTARELELALERGGPVLCTIHATEVAPTADPEAIDEAY